MPSLQDLLNAAGETSGQFDARMDPRWRAKLEARRMEKAASLAALQQQMRGIFPAFSGTPQSLEGLINARQMPNPAPGGMVPPPWIGTRG